MELANKLFMYTDVRFDMSSAGGGEPRLLPAPAICDSWKQGFEGLDAIHHPAGQYLVTLQGRETDVYAYAIASHYKKATTNWSTRIFVGSYD